MKGWLDETGRITWADLEAMGCDEWLWLDVDGVGVHCEGLLPQEPPRQATHVWGWGEGFAVRARLDPELPGVAAAVFRWVGAPPAGRAVVSASELESPVWPVGNGRANMAPVRGLNDPTPEALRTLLVPVVREAGHDTEVFTVSFVSR